MTDLASPRQLSGLAQTEQLQLLIAAVRDYAIYLLDADGEVVTWNPGAARFQGYAAEEIIGRNFEIFYTPEDRAAGLPARALAVAAADGRFEAEGWRVRQDGVRFWTHAVIDPVRDEAGEVIGYAKITRDISEKRAAEQALAESEQQFRLLVQGVRDYAIYMLDPNGVITSWNAGAKAIKGYAAEEVVGRNFSMFYPTEDQARGAPAMALAIARREGRYEAEAQRIRKGGEPFWANVVIDAIFDSQGQVIGFAKVTRDITERRAQQQALDASREALLQAQKMEAIGRLTGGVAHDFNNLLTVIQASADLLLRPGLSEEKRERYTQAIAETARRASVLTAQLLAFSRRQPLQPEVFDAGARLLSLREMLGATLDSAAEVRFDLPDEALWIRADPSQFETAILNMVLNAKDAMPSGGRIAISARPCHQVPPIRGHMAAKGDFVAVAIADTGVGIAPETLIRIFEPFFTTKPVDKGTGLGLSQVYGFAKQSQGDIDVVSTPGTGSTFTLYLPCAGDADRPAPPPPGPAPDPARTPRRRILMVEDNQRVGAFASALLQELGQSVTWVGDAQGALDILEARAADFDLVFTDVVMPGLSGVELAERIKARWPQVQVILTSGYSHVIAQEGAHGFPLLKKPYSIDDLLGALSQGPAADPPA